MWLCSLTGGFARSEVSVGASSKCSNGRPDVCSHHLRKYFTKSGQALIDERRADGFSYTVQVKRGARVGKVRETVSPSSPSCPCVNECFDDVRSSQCRRPHIYSCTITSSVSPSYAEWRSQLGWEPVGNAHGVGRSEPNAC